MESTVKALSMGFMTTLMISLIPIVFETFLNYKPPVADFGWVLFGMMLGVAVSFALIYVFY